MATRNYLLVLLFMFFCSAAFCQTQKGNFVLSGKTDLNFLFSNVSVGTDSIETGSTKSNQYGFTGGISYFIANNLSVGIFGTYSYNYTKVKSSNYLAGTTENITQTFTILPQVQYYFPLEGKLKPFVAIGVGYLWMEERDSRVTENYNKVYSISGPSFTGGAGLSYFITPSVAFDLGFQYSYNRLKDKISKGEIQKEHQINSTLGVSVFF
jgi:outer membrane protein